MDPAQRSGERNTRRRCGCPTRSSRSRLVAQDFRHATQRENEAVADYISRLEQLFPRTYGKEGMSTPQSVTGRLPQYPVPTPTVNCVLLQEMKKRGLLSWQYRKSKWGISTLSSRPGQTKDPAGSLYPES